MKSYKCSKAKVHWALANVLRNAPAKIQRKKTNATGREEEDDEEGETGSCRDNRENLTSVE